MKKLMFTAAVALMAGWTLCAEDLVVTGGATIPEGGATYDNVTIKSGGLKGGKLTIRSGGSIVQDGDSPIGSVISCAVQMGEGVKSSPITLFANTGGTLRFTGVISGPEDIRVTGGNVNAAVEFAANNTFDGDLTIVSGYFKAQANGAFGSTVGSTTYDCTSSTGPKMLFDGITTSENFHLRATASEMLLFGEGKTNTLNGDVEYFGTWQWWMFQANSTTYFNGPVHGRSGTASGFMGKGAATSAKIYWNGPLATDSIWYFQGGTHYHNNTFSTTSSWRPRGASGVFHLNYPNLNSRGANDCLRQEDGNAFSYVLGADQTYGYFNYGNNYGGNVNSSTYCNKNMSISSTNGSKFILTAANQTSQLYYGVMSGSAGLTLAGSGSRIRLGGANTSTGTLTVSNNAEAYFPANETRAWGKATGVWAGDIVLADRGRIFVNDSSSINSHGTIAISGTGSYLEIASDATLHCGKLVLDGVEAAGGCTWGAEGNARAERTTSHIHGDGLIYVYPGELVVTGDYVVPAAGVDCAAITVNGAATITGGAIRLMAGAQISVNAAANFNCPLQLGADAAENSVVVSVANGVTANFNGALSGPENVEIVGSGIVHLKGDSTFTGNLDIKGCHVYADSDNAFGSSAGSTTFDCKAVDQPQLTFNGITTPEPLRLNGETGSRLHFAGTNTFNGAIEYFGASLQWWDFQSASDTTFNGSVSARTGTATSFFGQGDERAVQPVIRWNGAVTANETWFFQGGRHYFGDSIRINGAGYWRMRGANYNGGTYVVLAAPGGITCAQRALEFRLEDSRAIKYELAGYDLTIDAFAFGNNAGAGATELTSSTYRNEAMSFTSSDGRVLVVNGTTASLNQPFYGRFEGNVGLTFASGGSSINLGGANTSTGTLTASNGGTVNLVSKTVEGGAVRVGEWKGAVAILDGGTINVEANACLFGVPSVTIAGEGSALHVPAGVVVTCGKLVLGDQEYTSGVFGAADNANVPAECRTPFITGGGTVNILTSQGDLVIDADYVVPPGGIICSRVSVTGDATISGGMISVPAGENAINISADVDFQCPINFMGGETETNVINVASGKTAVFKGCISGRPYVKSIGAGTIEFRAANSFSGPFESTGGVIHVYDGAAFGVVAGISSFNSTLVYFHGVTCPENMRFYKCAESSGNASALQVLPGTTNVFTGSVLLRGWLDAQADAWMQFDGAVTLEAGEVVFNRATPPRDQPCTYVFNGAIVDAGSSLKTMRKNVIVEFNGSVGVNLFMWVNAGTSGEKGTFRFGKDFVPNASKSISMGVDEKTVGYDDARIDLNGHDQRFNGAYKVSHAINSGNSVYSPLDRPAQIHASQAGTTVCYWTFTGAAGYAFEGVGNGSDRFTLMTPSDSAGVLSVTNGTMALDAGCAWPNVSAVNVGERGTFEFVHGSQTGRDTDFTLAATGRLVIPAGRVSAKSLTYAGVPMPPGRYSAASVPPSAPAAIRSCFSGAGSLRVGSNFYITFR